MSETAAIRIEGLGKRYRLGQQVGYKTLRESILATYHTPARVLAQSVRRRRRDTPASAPSASSRDFIWALKDVSFELPPGQALGVIGRNGSGKSTLLKVLSRITAPTEGRVELRGRVGSLLEVGTGFHPELTGRENVYLNGAIIGMKKAEIERKFDEIVAFAEIEKFLDTPVKRYSSGMYVRLAFAVAAHLEPEILLVDEVLAVGDLAFQRKCLGKMQDVAGEGRTVVFVSHNMGSIRRLCSRGIVLSNGQMAFDGDIAQAVDTYVDTVAGRGCSRTVEFQDDPSKPIVIRRVAVTSPGKGDSSILDVSDPLVVQIDYTVKHDIRGTNISFALSREDVVLFRSWDVDRTPDLMEMRRAGDYVARLKLPELFLASGLFRVYVAAGRPGIGPIVRHDHCLSFEIESVTQDLAHKSHSRGGALLMDIEWETTRP